MAMVLPLLAILIACGYGLSTLGIVEQRIAFNQHAGAATLASADAAVERALADLLPLTDFSPVLSGSLVSSFRIGSLTPMLPDGSQGDLTAITNEVQAITDADASWGGDPPEWRLFAFGPVNGLTGSAGFLLPAYLVVWVADDRADGDSDPAADSNGAVLLLGRAYGVAGSRTMEVLMTFQTMVSWREWR